MRQLCSWLPPDSTGLAQAWELQVQQRHFCPPTHACGIEKKKKPHVQKSGQAVVGPQLGNHAGTLLKAPICQHGAGSSL